ncbi:chalcone isomerase [Pyrus ussuriensis x Pyrus communis]|uniref:Chalcone-flavonone isomerase family protein n=1 Tax=Pyrus ussuriensis x Pyrus communis TaxID=2448454 RepID=A0A5N5H9N5_9ROSA|nr:chalcone isomerase [Pyrus ussuriensis x Pyrus communis]
MAPTPSLAGLQIETTAFPPSVKPPGSSNTLFLGGAGVRGLEIQGNFVKITAIGVYLEDNAVPQLAVKWKGKTAEELTESVEFFRDIVTSPFEKFIQVTTILPLTGQQYAEKVSEIKRAEETEDLDKVEEIPSSFPFKIEDTPEDFEDQIAYEGPDFHDLDENLQKAFHKTECQWLIFANSLSSWCSLGLVHGMRQFLHFRLDALHYPELVTLATMIKINEELH